MSRSERRRARENVPIEKIDDYMWRIPKHKQGMRVPGMVFANDSLMDKMKTDRTLWQCANVAHLPGIYKHAVTLPDGHEGYGFPIGGVAATDYNEGVISPGGVGYDINCGVRLLTTNLTENDVRPKLAQLAGTIFKNVPSGLGSRRKDFTLSHGDLDRLILEGVQWLAFDHRAHAPEMLGDQKHDRLTVFNGIFRLAELSIGSRKGACDDCQTN